MIVLFTVAILSVSAIGQNAYAAGAGISLSADCSGSSCDISGTTDRNDQDITMIIQASNGNIVEVGQFDSAGGSYSTSINVSNLDGTYTITVNQGPAFKYNLSVDIDVSGGSSDSSSSVAAIARPSTDNVSTPSLKKLTITASGIEGSNTINVSGTTDRSDVIIIKVTAPNGNIVSIDQITPSGDSYSTTIKTGGSLWSQDGMYTIKARQGPTTFGTSVQVHGAGFKAADDDNTGWLAYQASAEVEILDGHVIPEFGVIAAMILAVAIVSIIVVTAKTKLSIVPRY
jgi:predicted secreted protein with PEFG-CTERM motif